MVGRSQKPNGAYAAKKRIPDDVRDEYRDRHGQYHVAKFHAPAGTKPDEAKRRFSAWLSEVEDAAKMGPACTLARAAPS